MQGGIAVNEDGRRNKMMGYVLATNACDTVEPNDIVFFGEGTTEPLRCANGEVIHWLAERDATGIDEDFWPKPKEETQLASGLILPGRE